MGECWQLGVNVAGTLHHTGSRTWLEMTRHQLSAH